MPSPSGTATQVKQMLGGRLRRTKENMYRYLAIVLIIISFFGCHFQKEKYYFEKMISNPVIGEYEPYSALYSYDLKTGDKNKYQDRLIRIGTDGNDYLLDMAYKDNFTKYIIPNIVSPLKDGDIAIALLLTINKISDDVFLQVLVNEEIKGKYKEEGSSVWWDWIHKKQENGEWVIKQLRGIVK